MKIDTAPRRMVYNAIAIGLAITLTGCDWVSGMLADEESPKRPQAQQGVGEAATGNRTWHVYGVGPDGLPTWVTTSVGAPRVSKGGIIVELNAGGEYPIRVLRGDGAMVWSTGTLFPDIDYDPEPMASRQVMDSAKRTRTRTGASGKTQDDKALQTEWERRLNSSGS